MTFALSQGERIAAVAGFAAGTAIVLVVFFRELSTRATAARLRERVREQADEEAKWRLFLRRWEEAA